MHPWTIFSSIILLAMANEIFGGGGRKDKIAREYQFSTGHSSKTSFDRAMDKALEGTKDLAKKIPKVAKKKAVSFAKGFGKAVQQVVTKRGDYTREYKKNLQELKYISSDVYINNLNEMRAQTERIIEGFRGYSKHFKSIKGAVDQLNSNKEFKGSIYYSITELFLNGSMKVEESDEIFQMIVGAINEYHGNEESLYRQRAKSATLKACVKIEKFASDIFEHEKRESSSFGLAGSISTPEVEKLNKAFNQIKNKPAIIYFIYLYEQKRTGEDTKDYKDKINKLRGLAGNIPNFNREHYEKQNLKDLEKYIYNNLSIQVIGENYFENDLLTIKFHFDWSTFTFKQTIHDPSYQPTPLESGIQSFAESSRQSTSMQRSGQDSPEYPTTAFSQGEGHGEIQPAEGHQLGWQGGYPPQWPGYPYPTGYPPSGYTQGQSSRDPRYPPHY
uniref:Uncharacterized protein n=1 Tax=Meloidogyne floridensis TaxID=298350 RepID=A0A915NWY6_9BILA